MEMEMERRKGKGMGCGLMERQERGKEGRKEERREIWRDNITCVKRRRVCAHRNMFNGFYDCWEGCVRCVSDRVMYALHVCKQQGVYGTMGIHVVRQIYDTCAFIFKHMCLDTLGMDTCTTTHVWSCFNLLRTVSDIFCVNVRMYESRYSLY